MPKTSKKTAMVLTRRPTWTATVPTTSIGPTMAVSTAPKLSTPPTPPSTMTLIVVQIHFVPPVSVLHKENNKNMQ